jgi:hypothetical protein
VYPDESLTTYLYKIHGNGASLSVVHHVTAPRIVGK